ncbi:cytochrome P450 [Aspergillus navahoensis]
MAIILRTLRAMTEGFFMYPASIALKPEIQSIVDSLIDSVKHKGCQNGPIDLIAELAAPLNPRALLHTIFKVSEEDANELLISDSSLAGTSRTASESGQSTVHDFMSKLIDSRISSPGKLEDDLISELVVEQYQKGKLDRDGMINLLHMLLVAGNSAIMSSTALGVYSLLQHPEQLEELKKNPALAEGVVEEVLRYHTPSTLNSKRVAREDTTLDGQEIKAGTGIIGYVRSANRDERESRHPTNSTCTARSNKAETWLSALEPIIARVSGFFGLNCRLCLVGSPLPPLQSA